MATDIFAPGKGYTYYYGVGDIYRKAAFRTVQVWTAKKGWVDDLTADVAHDLHKVDPKGIEGLAKRILGEVPSGFLDKS